MEGPGVQSWPHFYQVPGAIKGTKEKTGAGKQKLVQAAGEVRDSFPRWVAAEGHTHGR